MMNRFLIDSHNTGDVMKTSGLSLATLALALFLTGCQGETKSAVPASTVSLPAAPESDLSVLNATEVKDSESLPEVVLVSGRIDSGADAEVFQPGQMTFMMSQMPDASHADGDPDHADNCPFCAMSVARAPKVIVNFTDSSGAVRSGDPRTALGVKKGDAVLVEGKATFNPDLKVVEVQATAVYQHP